MDDVSNTTGIFTAEELELEPDGGYSVRFVPATATFSDRTVLPETTSVCAPFIENIPD